MEAKRRRENAEKLSQANADAQKEGREGGQAAVISPLEEVASLDQVDLLLDLLVVAGLRDDNSNEK